MIIFKRKPPVDNDGKKDEASVPTPHMTTYLKNSRSRPRAPLASSGISPLFIKIMEFNKREPRQKRSPPHILADEHFNPPPAD
jgi:hypothetical protein